MQEKQYALEFSGIPFTSEAKIVYDCMFGKDNHQNRKVLDHDDMMSS